MTSIPKTYLHQDEKLGFSWLLFDGPDYISEHLARNEFFEANVISACIDLLGKSSPGIVLDIGANLGSFVVPVSKCVDHEFICFEPQRVIFYQLCANLLLNRLDKVKANNYALGNKEEIIDIAVPQYNSERNIGAFSLDSMVKTHEPTSEGNLEQIQIKTLDSLNYNNIRLIKLDVEGFELSVLQGAVQTLKNNQYPPIVFESWNQFDWWQERSQQLMNFINSLGYKIYNISNNNHLALHQNN